MNWYTMDWNKPQLGDGLKYFLFSPLLAEDSHVDKYCSKGLKPPTSDSYRDLLIERLPRMGFVLEVHQFHPKKVTNFRRLKSISFLS